MNIADIVVTNADGVVYTPFVSRSARARAARAARARNAIVLTTHDDNPSIDTASRERERIATDEITIDNLRAAKSASEDPDGWYDPYNPWENP